MIVSSYQQPVVSESAKISSARRPAPKLRRQPLTPETRPRTSFRALVALKKLSPELVQLDLVDRDLQSVQLVGGKNALGWRQNRIPVNRGEIDRTSVLIAAAG